MNSISIDELAIAIRRVQHMSLKERELLADEIHAQQPNLLFSVLCLHRMGASLEQLEVVIVLLFEFHEAMKETGLQWPVIDEAMQERCLALMTGRMRFIESLTPEQQTQIITQATEEHPERLLLAHAYETLRVHGLVGVRTEAEKYLMLAALNLVECIAEAAPPREGQS